MHWKENQRSQKQEIPRLPAETLDNPIGRFARILAGNEPPEPIFMLLFQILGAAISDWNITIDTGIPGWEPIDMEPVDLPVLVLKPTPPRTEAIFNFLLQRGDLTIVGDNDRGTVYEILYPAKGERRKWMLDIFDLLEQQIYQEAALISRRKWYGLIYGQAAKNLERITDELEELL